MSAEHAYYVQRAARWLRGTRKCRVVATEKAPPHIAQIPDAVGWSSNGYAIGVECKLSLADFRADRRKIHARQGWTVGHERWYLAPPGVLKPGLLAEGIGLIELHSHSIKVVVPAKCRLASMEERAQIIMLTHVAWHAAAHHFGQGKGRLASITADFSVLVQP